MDKSYGWVVPAVFAGIVLAAIVMALVSYVRGRVATRRRMRAVDAAKRDAAVHRARGVSLQDADDMLRASGFGESVISEARRSAVILTAITPPPSYDVYRVRAFGWWIRVPLWVQSWRWVWTHASAHTGASSLGPRFSRDEFGGDRG